LIRHQLGQIQGKIYTEDKVSNLKSGNAHCSEFVMHANVYRIKKIIEEETVQLLFQDGASMLEWVRNLQEQGHFVEFKSSSDPPPEGSGLAADSFVLIIQTQYQWECCRKHAHHYAGIDATHNTTHYENMSLFMLVVQDKWGHG
jgi:hypothetical protein